MQDRARPLEGGLAPRGDCNCGMPGPSWYNALNPSCDDSNPHAAKRSVLAWRPDPLRLQSASQETHPNLEPPSSTKRN